MSIHNESKGVLPMSDSHENKSDWAEAYVLGGLTDEETKEFEIFLQTSPECRAKVEELTALVNLLPLAAESVPVPTGMKQRSINQAFEQAAAHPPQAITENSTETASVVVPIAHATASAAGQMGRVYRMVMTIGLSAAVIVLALYSAELKRDVEDLKLHIAIASEPLTASKVNEAVALSPAASDIVAEGLATILIDSSGTHLVIQAEKLPELKGNQAFQVWLLKDKQPVNAGTFLSQDGNGALYYTFDPNGYDTVAITLEPDAHGKIPRGTVILAAPIKGSS
jgi:anti-sigma-K factor RskA